MAKYTEKSDIIEASIDNDMLKLKALISTGSDLNSIDKNGWAALHFASQNGNIEIVKLLVESGAKIDIQDNFGNTPLFRAVFNCKGKGEVIKYLLLNHANKDLKNKSGISPYELAKTIANYSIVQFFE